MEFSTTIYSFKGREDKDFQLRSHYNKNGVTPEFSFVPTLKLGSETTYPEENLKCFL